MSARVVTIEPLLVGYDEDIVLQLAADLNEARAVVAGADWIISSGDGDYEAFDQLLDQFSIMPDAVKLATRHAGSAFRSDSEYYNREDRDRGFLRRFICSDIYRLAASDPCARVYVPPIDELATELPRLPFRVCHSPSSRSTKGTATILKITRGLGIECKILEGLPYHECLRRRRNFSILIDQMNPQVGGFGASACEALAEGMAVIADTRHCGPEVDQWIPRPPILHAPNAAALRKHLTQLRDDELFLDATRTRSLRWAKTYLSSEFTYSYWKTALSACATSDRC